MGIASRRFDLFRVREMMRRTKDSRAKWHERARVNLPFFAHLRVRALLWQKQDEPRAHRTLDLWPVANLALPGL